MSRLPGCWRAAGAGVCCPSLLFGGCAGFGFCILSKSRTADRMLEALPECLTGCGRDRCGAALPGCWCRGCSVKYDFSGKFAPMPPLLLPFLPSLPLWMSFPADDLPGLLAAGRALSGSPGSGAALLRSAPAGAGCGLASLRRWRFLWCWRWRCFAAALPLAVLLVLSQVIRCRADPVRLRVLHGAGALVPRSSICTN